MAEDAAGKVKRAPFPTDATEFANDDRVSYDQVSQSHKLEDEIGEEWEWLPQRAKWVPVTDAALVAQQQSVYAMPGVDENEPAMDLRKRKAAVDEMNGKSKKQKSEKPAKQNNAIYVTSLPLDADKEEVADVFKKCGMLAESLEDNEARIKLYTDEDGNFKGDALVVYHRPESVGIAIDILDGADFRPGSTGPMRVSVADQSYKAQKDQPLKSEHAKTKGTGANRDREKAIKKNEEMNSRLADWDDDDPSTVKAVSNRHDKVVILKHMFSVEEVSAKPEEIIDLRDEIREECEKYGTVTNLVLYDKEPDGVVTLRYDTTSAAEAAVRALQGRWFDSRRLEAYISDGSEKFVKSGKGDTEDEAERLENFGKFLEGKDEEPA